MNSILAQDHTGPVEICVWDDSSSDSSLNEIESYRSDIEDRKWKLLIGQNGQTESPHGPGQFRVIPSSARYPWTVWSAECSV